jgi:predicted  nucleic acid-binding Zn-ribbon protein
MLDDDLEAALNLWIERLATFEKELAITDSTSKKFELKKQIEDCDEKITSLKAKIDSLDLIRTGKDISFASKNKFFHKNIYQLDNLFTNIKDEINIKTKDAEHWNNLLRMAAVESKEKSSRPTDLYEVNLKINRYEKELKLINDRLDLLYRDLQEIEDAIKQKIIPSNY